MHSIFVYFDGCLEEDWGFWYQWLFDCELGQVYHQSFGEVYEEEDLGLFFKVSCDIKFWGMRRK